MQIEPQFVVLAGDWHGNHSWVLNYAIPEADRLLTEAGETRKIIIQLGDFGFRLAPGEPGSAWTYQISLALDRRGMELWWIDGNHEFWPEILQLVDADGNGNWDSPGIRIMPSVQYLPRGTRWTWHGKTWLAVGGAVSVDKLLRSEGVSWWPEEEIAPVHADAIIAGGHADVLLSHDVPACWFPPHLPPPQDVWRPVLPQARAHSRLLERIARGTGVSRNFHGHYHIARDDFYPEARVTGLLEDGFDGNLLLVDVERL